MPKSDTWPCGSTMETMTGMDSAGSCDSVVSINSGSSDDSLEHLSAEEKACLMFLEETIESLDMEEDSGLSNDEPDRLPAPGNVASKMAHLSASMDNSKLNNASKHPCKQLIRDVGKPAFGYLVPTPLVLANGSSGPLPKSRPGVTPDKENSRPGPELPPSDPKSRQGSPRIPSEVNVVVIPPPTKPRDPPGCWGSEGASPRGPLSYDALVQLRKSASMKRVPDSPPAVDSSKQPPGPAVAMKAHPWSRQPRGPSAAWPQDTLHHQEPSGYNPSPPVVAPKPKRMSSNVSLKPQSGAAASYPPLASSLSDRPLSDPQRVRREALQKLGLLRENGAEPRPAAAPPGPSEPHPSWDASPRRPRQEDNPPLSNPGGGQPFSYTQAPREPAGATPRPPQSPRWARPVVPSRVKAATLERSGVGLGSLTADRATAPPPQPRSASLGGQQGDGYSPLAAPGGGAPETASPAATAPLAQPAPQKPTPVAGFSMATVPSMGPDRREALRKLGLLKN